MMPNFAQVYSFIGSVFDPQTTGHVQRLKQMDPINLETVCGNRHLAQESKEHYLNLSLDNVLCSLGPLIDEKLVCKPDKPRV